MGFQIRIARILIHSKYIKYNISQRTRASGNNQFKVTKITIFELLKYIADLGKNFINKEVCYFGYLFFSYYFLFIYLLYIVLTT